MASKDSHKKFSLHSAEPSEHRIFPFGDPYKALGVAQTATEKMIESAYQAKVEYHKDNSLQ